MDLLIDGDILAYRHACAAESKRQTDDGILYITFDTHQACWACHREIHDLIRRWRPASVKVCLSDRRNFRKAICPAYKANRKNIIRPQSLATVVEHVERYWSVERWPGLEADDVMGILATQPGADCLIVSSDKDMRQIPCKLSRDGETFAAMSPEGADWNFYTQVLTGDSTDGYTGIPGIGPKKAERILSEAQGGFWPAIRDAYAAAGLAEDEALKQARLARILRASDYDLKLQMVLPWRPE